MAMPLSPVSQITATPATPDKQSAAGASDTAFSHVLTHEMTQQQDVKSSAPNSTPSGEPLASADPSKKTADASQSADAATAAANAAAALQTTLPPISAELLAMMGNYAATHAVPTTTTVATTKLPSTTAAANTALTSSTTNPAKLQNNLLSAPPLLTAAANNASADAALAQASAQTDIKFADKLSAATALSTDMALVATQKNNSLTLPEPVPVMASLLPNPVLMANLAQNATPQSVSGLSAHVGTSAWNNALGDKIVWMVGGAEQTASLTLNPPDLGPLQIVLNVSNNQANATFIAAQPEVRLAIEAALPRLHEMMNNAGIQLGQTNVRSDSSSQQEKQSEAHAFRPLSAARSVGVDNSSKIAGKMITGKGLVNTFV